MWLCTMNLCNVLSETVKALGEKESEWEKEFGEKNDVFERLGKHFNKHPSTTAGENNTGIM